METNDLVTEIENAVDEAILSRKSLQRQAVVGAVTLVLLAALVASPIFTNVFGLRSNHDEGPYLIGSGALIVAAYFFWRWCNSSFENTFAKRIMPILCNIAGGFSYRIDGHDAAEWVLLQFGLFTNVDRSHTAHRIKGSLGDVPFQFWNNVMIDVRHGKNQSNITKFSGYIIEIPKPEGLSNFLIRPVKSELGRKVKAFFGGTGPKPFRSDTEITQRGGPNLAMFLLTNSQEQALHDWATMRIRKTNQELGHYASFFGLLQHQDELYLAIEDSSAPFNFSGLFSSKSELLSDAQTAMDEILLPLKIIQIWQK